MRFISINFLMVVLWNFPSIYSDVPPFYLILAFCIFSCLFIIILVIGLSVFLFSCLFYIFCLLEVIIVVYILYITMRGVIKSAVIVDFSSSHSYIYFCFILFEPLLFDAHNVFLRGCHTGAQCEAWTQLWDQELDM